MNYELYDHQKKALPNIHNGCILAGGVGSGKSRTSLAYYDQKIGRDVPLYIITTAKKRDNMEWDEELLILGNRMPVHVIDSWNNIGKYQNVTDSFFIFDEDRITGKGAWVKTFLKIAKNNRWLVLSATPGDKWEDYIPIFIANGFYRNRTEFQHKHIIWNRYTDFPKIDGYINTGYLNGLRRKILVPMDFERKTVRHHEDIYCSYSPVDYKRVIRNTDTASKGQIVRRESLIISPVEQPGFKLAPIFNDGLEYVLLPAYDGSLVNSKLASVAGVKPINNLTRDEAETYARARGTGWHIMTMAAESANQMLEMVEFGHMNGQAAIEEGITYIPTGSNGEGMFITGSTAALGNGTGHADSTIMDVNGT